MESVKADGDDNKELDDSGYVQDEGPHKSSTDNGKLTNLLDLSDDVLLYILSHCQASDLKALGFSCTRLAALIRDRTLWHRVDARDRPYGRKRLRWLLDHALHAGTTHLYLKGYAEHCVGCEGYVNGFRKEVEEKTGDLADRPCSARQHRNWIRDPQNPLPRANASPSWPDEDPPRTEVSHPDVPACPGPHFTLTPCLLRRLQQQCNITHFQADLCNINCNATPLSLFPSTLTHLSLRGTKCFNVPNVEKSFLFQIQDHLPHLEYLDLSESTWLEPSCLLPLSKLPRLKKLFMTNCPRMTEFVAYGSLAARYGFKKLQVFDLRGSPIGDSEAAALGWLPALEELYLAAHAGGRPTPPRHPHQHYKDDDLPAWQELSCWELHEPAYFKKILSQQKRKRSKGDPEEKCFHNVPFHKCVDGYCDGDNKQYCKKYLKRKNSSDEPGPSKRRKSLPPSSDTDDDDDDDEEMQDDASNVDHRINSENVSEYKSGENGEGGNGTVNNEGGEAVDHGDGEQPNNEQREGMDQVNDGEPGHIFFIERYIRDQQHNVEQHNNVEQPNNGEEPNNEEEQNNGEGNNQGNGEGAAQNENVEARPRIQILYMNLGRQNHPIFRAVSLNDDIRRLRRQFRIPLPPMPAHLISDSAIRSFGNSDDDNVNYFHIGGPPNPQNARPSKSNLRILSVQGYQKITDRSLMHLRTSAPKLEVIDFTETSVTEKGVEKFKSRRPDVKVFYSGFVDTDGPLESRVELDG